MCSEDGLEDDFIKNIDKFYEVGYRSEGEEKCDEVFIEG